MGKPGIPGSRWEKVMAQQTALNRPNRSLFGAVIASTWQGIIKDLRTPYRPERHYMRGPGPKWHAKHPYGMAEGGIRPGRTR
jgi:hypothetical protein